LALSGNWGILVRVLVFKLFPVKKLIFPWFHYCFPEIGRLSGQLKHWWVGKLNGNWVIWWWPGGGGPGGWKPHFLNFLLAWHFLLIILLNHP